MSHAPRGVEDAWRSAQGPLVRFGHDHPTPPPADSGPGARPFPGHRESVYVNLLRAALELKGYRVARERIFPVLFDGTPMGRVEADLEAESRVIVEIKRGVRGLDKGAQDQLLSNVTTSGRPVGVLLNFHGERVGSILVWNPFKVRRDRLGGSP